MRRALVIVGKAPEPGRAKTRLLPSLSPAGAAELYRGFLLDSVSLGLELGWERVSVVHPKGDGPALADLLPSRVRLLEQPGHGLGDALAHAFEQHLGEGSERVVLVGSDTPTLPASIVEQACAAQTDHDLSLGPSPDGGYYLIGMRQAHPGVFSAIDWSTSRVYRQTLDRARSLALRVHTLPPWYDVDQPADLQRLQRELLTAPHSVAPHTRAVLDRLTTAAVSR